MILTVAVDLALRSSLLLGGAWLAATIAGARGGSAAIRHTVWMLGFATLASLPLLAWVLPPLHLPVLPADPVSPMPAAAATAHPARTVPSASAPDPILLIYLAVAALLLARLALGRVLLERIWRKADPADEWGVETDRIARLLGIRRPVELRIAARRTVPMTWGSFRPRILLPRDALRWDAGRLQSVLLHELGHVSRHDSLGTLIAQAVCAFFWANPLAWHALRQMRLAQEQACDDLVLANGAAATSYARDLLASACTLHPSLAGAAVGMSGRNDLELRLKAILGAASRRRPSATFVTIAAAAGAASGALVAAVVPVAAQSPVEPVAEVAAAALILPTMPAAPQPPATRRPRKRTLHLLPAPTPHARTAVALPASAALPPAALTESEVYAQELAEYRRQKAAYRLDLERHRAELDVYRAELDVYRAEHREYRRKHRAHRQRVAELGSNPPLGVTVPPAPIAPIPPIAPIAPTAPTVPTVPTAQHRLPHST